MSRKLKVPALALPPAQEAIAQQLIKRFMAERFELELGGFEALEVLELVRQELAPLFYNQAVADVQAVLAERFASLESDIWALEKS